MYSLSFTQFFRMFGLLIEGRLKFKKKTVVVFSIGWVGDFSHPDIMVLTQNLNNDII